MSIHILVRALINASFVANVSPIKIQGGTMKTMPINLLNLMHALTVTKDSTKMMTKENMNTPTQANIVPRHLSQNSIENSMNVLIKMKNLLSVPTVPRHSPEKKAK